MSLRLALRNLSRNKWRTGLTVGGIAVATALMIWTNGMLEAFLVQMVESATAADTGHMQIHATEYVDEPSIHATFRVDEAKLDEVRKLDGVEGATGRIVSYALVGHEKRSQVAKLVGVDPQTEPTVTNMKDGIDAGRWLADAPATLPGPREAVLGYALASQLDVGPGAELVVFLQAADGSLGNDSLKIVGTVRSGNMAIDRQGVIMHLADVQWLAALDGRLHEVSIRTPRLTDLKEAQQAVQGVVAGAQTKLSVRRWDEITPYIHQMVELSRSSVWVMYVIIFLIAALGILNTQRMSALERRREFGVLLAIGQTPGRLGRLIVLETVVLTSLGALVGAAIGVGITYYHATAGFDMGMAASGGESFSYMGVNFENTLYFVLTPQTVLPPVLIIAFMGVFCGLWPALKSARLDAVRAIAGRT